MIQEQSDEEGEKHRQETCYDCRINEVLLGGRRPDNGNITEFYWQPSGVPISYSRWRPGQPHPGNDDCNCIMITMEHDWLWDDNGCSTHAMYMCQIFYDG
ncbi:hypothetical protein LSH36_1658g00008 [Paralvinella palmiformis]|uniref:C-type lectin domain-containing protein n=1 Tax=Paralvinella palmiformis TaxID=53620 RepID=A0AAD9ISE8_9ANNE|nr:hypothetical protein LSH36_1658g00008 [Paralvinella palmiformis]